MASCDSSLGRQSAWPIAVLTSRGRTTVHEPVKNERIHGKDITGIETTVLVASSFHTRKNTSENYPQIGHAHSEKLASPALGRRSLNNIGFIGRQIVSLPSAPSY